MIARGGSPKFYERWTWSTVSQPFFIFIYIFLFSPILTKILPDLGGGYQHTWNFLGKIVDEITNNILEKKLNSLNFR
jgi:hypothetical protein